MRIDTVASGLEIPWDVAFLPDGRALVTERPGRIRVIDDEGRLHDEPWAEVDVFTVAEAGLLGIDIGPSRRDGRYEIYVSAIVQDLGGNALSRVLKALGRRIMRMFDPERGHARYQEILRIVETDGVVSRPEVIVDGVPSAPVHAGGVVRFAPDGSLFITNGDAAVPVMAQEPWSLRGKVLRYRPDGTVPGDNPFPDSPVWAMGVRNVQGLAWHPSTGDLFAVDHGPTGLERESFRTDEDELNVVKAGDNLGWPVVTGPTRGGGLTTPIVTWPNAIAPAGLAILDLPASPWHGSAFVTGLRGTSLRRIGLARTEAGWGARCEEPLLVERYGRLRLIRTAPDSTIWIGTSNRDQNGLPRRASDQILRLHPPR